MHSATATPPEKKKKLSKINAGKCEVRWELLLAAVAKNGCRAAGMSCGSVEEPSPGSPCPVRAEAAQGAVLGACQAYGAAAGETTQPVIAAGDRGLFLSSQGGRTAASPPSGSHAAAHVMFSDEGYIPDLQPPLWMLLLIGVCIFPHNKSSLL